MQRLRAKFKTTLLLVAFLGASVVAGCGSYGGDSSNAADRMNAEMGAGTSARKWVRGQQTPNLPSARFTLAKQDISIQMRDGVALVGTLSLPQGLPSRSQPCVLVANGYGHDSEIARTLVDHGVFEVATRGYPVVHLSLRGSGGSGGKQGFYEGFNTDGYDAVEWMAKQEWCNGRVGMVGGSLLGIVQWFTARSAPPSLKAIVPHNACGDCYDGLWYQGGTLPGPGRAVRVAPLPPEYTLALEHRNFDQFWLERTTLAADHQAIANRGVAVMVTDTWQNYVMGNVQAYEDMPQSAARKLIIGPQPHTGDITNLAPYTYGEYVDLWFGRYLRGIQNGVDKEPAVLIYVQGPNLWRREDTWPIADTHYTVLAMAPSKSSSISSVNDGSLVRLASSKGDLSPVSIDYSPTKGPFVLTYLNTTKGRDTSDHTASQRAALTWTSQVLTKAMEVTGAMKVNFSAAIAGTDADFAVEVSDVAPDGSSTQVTAGYLNASHAASRSKPDAVAQGIFRPYSVEIMRTSYVFKAGHRLRIAVAGGADGGTATHTQGPGKSPYPSRISVAQTPGSAYAIVPIVGTGWQQF